MCNLASAITYAVLRILAVLGNARIRARRAVLTDSGVEKTSDTSLSIRTTNRSLSIRPTKRFGRAPL